MEGRKTFSHSTCPLTSVMWLEAKSSGPSSPYPPAPPTPLLIFTLSCCSSLSSLVPASGLAPLQPPAQSSLRCTSEHVGPSPTPLNGARGLPSHGPADLSSIFSHLHSSQINNSWFLYLPSHCHPAPCPYFSVYKPNFSPQLETSILLENFSDYSPQVQWLPAFPRPLISPSNLPP